MSKEMRRRSTMESILTQGSQDMISQWEIIMRRFSEDTKRLNSHCRIHENELAVLKQREKRGNQLPTTITPGFPKQKLPIRRFITGSTYDGTWDALGMSGHGVYTFPNGTIYEGDFQDGDFHGQGVLKYSNGIKVIGTWAHGAMKKRTVVFEDGIKFDENNWRYCTDTDRRYGTLRTIVLAYLSIKSYPWIDVINRFSREYQSGIEPVGSENREMTAKKQSEKLPDNCYDTCDGFYDPHASAVFSYEDPSHIVRCTEKKQHNWILKNCRSKKNPIGPLRPSLFSEHPDPEPSMPSVPSPPALLTPQNSSCNLQNISSIGETWSRIMKQVNVKSGGWSKRAIQFDPFSQT